MITPSSLDLTVYRWQPFYYAIDFVGPDFTAATFAMQVRLYPDAEGSALISLVGATAGTQGLSVATTTDGDGVVTSTVTIQIDETTIEALLPYPASGVQPGADVVLAYDLVITGGGYAKTRWFFGAFNISPGVTQ